MTIDTQQREVLLRTLAEVWPGDEGVKRFGLRYVPEEIEQRYGAWLVPVVPDAPAGSAYQLARDLEHLMEQIENRSSLRVTLFLDPFAGSDRAIAKPA